MSAPAEPPDGPRVYSMRRGAAKPPAGAVRCDRKSPYGNPFVMGPDGDRAAVLAKHEAWFFAPEQAAFREQVRRELRGRDLKCWCAPEGCHCDLLVRFANA